MKKEFEKEAGKTSDATEAGTLDMDKETESNTETDEADSEIKPETVETHPVKKGIIADAFDADTIIPEKEESERNSDKEGIKIKYQFTGEEVKTALKIFQKYTIYKKNLIYSAIIFVILVVYLFSIAGNPSSKFSLFMSVLCIIVLLAIWYFPLNHIRQMVKAIDQMEGDDMFSITVYDDAVEIGEGQDRSVFVYEKDPIRVWETDTLFIIGYDKFRVFVVPKRFCKEKENEIRAFFQEGLKENYKRLEG